MIKSFYDKIHPDKSIKNRSKLKRIRNRKQRLKNKHILKSINLDNISFEDKRNRMHVPKNHERDFDFSQVLFINKFMEKNLNKSWNEIFHKLKEQAKFSKGKKKVSFRHLIDLLTNPLYFKRRYFDYFVINDLLINKKTYSSSN